VHPHLATGVGATSPMDSHGLRDVQLLLQLLHNSHGPVLGLDDRHSTELSPRTGHKASRQVSWVDLEPAEPSSLERSGQQIATTSAKLTPHCNGALLNTPTTATCLKALIISATAAWPSWTCQAGPHHQ